jgi:hypothetical protein
VASETGQLETACAGSRPGHNINDAFGPITALGSRQAGNLGFTVWADNTSEPTVRIVFKVTSDEKSRGSWGTMVVNLQFSDSQPILFFSPNHIETGGSFSGMATEAVTLENRGLADLNDVSLSLVSPDGRPTRRIGTEGNCALSKKVNSFELVRCSKRVLSLRRRDPS